MQLGWREVLSKPYHPDMGLSDNFFFKIFFFLMCTIFKVFVELVTILFVGFLSRRHMES